MTDLTVEVGYVGGPRGGQREERQLRPKVIKADGGAYARSFQCADDGALRYVWKPGPVKVPERSLWICRPCTDRRATVASASINSGSAFSDSIRWKASP